MRAITAESRSTPFDAIRQQVDMAGAALESRIARFAAMTDSGAHTALRILTDLSRNVVSAARDPYSNVFTFTEEGNAIQIAGRSKGRPFFTESEAEVVFRSLRKPRR